MIDDILVPTDGSTAAEAAGRRAVGLARTVGATVHALSVVDTSREPGDVPDDVRGDARGEASERGRDATITIVDDAADADLAVIREVRYGVPAREILAYVDESDVDMVVMGGPGHGTGSARRLGTTARRVLTRADVPVVLDPGTDVSSDDARGTYTDIVVGTDGSDAAERAADHGLTVAELTGADVHVAYVVDSGVYGFDGAPRSIVGLLKEGGRNAVDAIVDAADERSVPASAAILRGPPSDVILQYATGAGADLLVVGSRGQSASDDAFLGSTTERLAIHTPLPLLSAR